ncbi:MAG TPA: ABC transporter permease [Candidatus Binataceae bacterium]|nr:ABC transporter permease [Candidatus Binataceae bacterium]
MFGRIYHLLAKEFIQLRRDKWARLILFLPPIVQMLIFGYAATFEVYHVQTVVLDQDHSQESRELAARFTANGRFELGKPVSDERQIRDAIDRGKATIAIQIHPQFAELLRKGQSAPVQVVLDGTNSNTALIALDYIGQISAVFAQDYQRDYINRVAPRYEQLLPSVGMQERPWYNPDLNSQWFFVPGVVGTLVLVTVMNLTAFAIVVERELGTLEQIMVTPIRPVEFILGKTVPFFLIGLVEVAMVAGFGTLWFEIPFRGNPLVLLLGTSLFLISTLAIGLLISTLCSTQQQAFASGFLFLNPAITLSGFAFPIASMPTVMQWLTYVDPLRYYLVVLRGTFLKGTGMQVLWPQMLAMGLLGAVLLSASVLRFRKSLD